MNPTIHGDFELVPSTLTPEAEVALTLAPNQMTAHWHRCGLVSDFVAGYIASAYPKAQREALVSAVSTVFQELIENAVKFSRKREAPLHVRIAHYSRILLLEVENGTTPAFAQRFAGYLQTMATTEDLAAAYLGLLEARSSGVDAHESGIGLLVLRKDHGVRLGVRFASDAQGRPTVTVRVFQTLEV